MTPLRPLYKPSRLLPNFVPAPLPHCRFERHVLNPLRKFKDRSKWRSTAGRILTAKHFDTGRVSQCSPPSQPYTGRVSAIPNHFYISDTPTLPKPALNATSHSYCNCTHTAASKQMLELSKATSIFVPRWGDAGLLGNLASEPHAGQARNATRELSQY